MNIIRTKKWNMLRGKLEIKNILSQLKITVWLNVILDTIIKIITMMTEIDTINRSREKNI